MTSSGLTDFVPFPRQVLSDRKSGKLTPNEYEMYMFVRHGAGPFGIASVSFEGLLADFAHHKWKDKNYPNKLLLSLRHKRYLHYEDRTGRSGSFEIRFPEFAPRAGVSTRLPEEVLTPKKKRSVSTPAVIQSEVRPSSTPVSPRLDVKKDEGLRSFKDLLDSKVRASYTDTYTNKENNRFLKRDFKIAPGLFTPENPEEGTCKEIALELGEASMSFLLGTLRKYGFDVIEWAWGVYRHDMPDKSKILNRRAYFNKIVTQRIEDLAKDKKV